MRFARHGFCAVRKCWSSGWRKLSILLVLTVVALAFLPFTVRASNECEDYARQLGIDEQVVSILSWLCLDGVMDEQEKEFMELLALLPPDQQVRLALDLALDGQISESDLETVREASNLIENPGFEQEGEGWWFDHPPGVTWEFDRQEPYEGQISLKVTSHGARAMAWSRPVIIRPNQEYTFSVWLKADRPHLKVWLYIWGESEPHWYIHKQVCLTTSWEQYQFTSVIPQRLVTKDKIRVRFDIMGEGTLRADAVDFRATEISTTIREDYTRPAEVLFYLPFEGSAEAETAQGDRSPIEQQGISYVEGIKGQAVMIDDDDTLCYATSGNLDKEKGSIEMWVKPNWNAFDEGGIYHAFFMEDGPPEPGSGALHLLKPEFLDLNFTVRDCEGHYEMGDIIAWRRNDWHHIVVTWDYRVGTRMYIDGVFWSIPGEYYNDFTWKVREYSKMFIGSWEDWAQADAAIDEFHIYDRPLNRTEVKTHYAELMPVNFLLEHSIFRVNQSADLTVVLANNRDEQVTGDLRYELVAPSGNTVTQAEETGINIKAEGESILRVPFQPEEEGEYLLNLFWNGDTSYRRLLTLFVIPQHTEEAVDQTVSSRLQLSLIEEIDAVSVTSPDRYTDDGTANVVHSPIGSYREAGGKQSNRFAYRFRVDHPQVAHLIVIEFPDDKERIFDIVMHSPRFVHSYDIQTGLYTGDEYPLTHAMHEHKILFWPREEENALVFMTWEEGKPAAVAKIRIYEITAGLPEMSVNVPEDEPRRLLGLWWEDPSLPWEFGQTDYSLSQLYQTFTRLMEYLKYTGQNLIVYPIVWYTGPLYPSRAEPEYVSHHRRPYHPGDWVELLLEVAEDYGIFVIPSLTIHSLPSLMREANTDAASVRAGEDTINLIACDGVISKNFINFYMPGSDLVPGPIFDPLHPKVQARIFALVDEILDRYGDAPAFTGLSFNLNAWAHNFGMGFGSLDLGYGDNDVNLFEQETGIQIPVDATDPERFHKRCAFLTQGNSTVRERWINWRCEKIHDLWMDIHQKLQDKREDLKLVLSFQLPYTAYYGADDRGRNQWSLFAWQEGEPFAQFVYEMYREGGVDLDLYKDVEGLHTEREVEPSNYRWMKTILTHFPSAYFPRMVLSRDIQFDTKSLNLFANEEKTAVAIFNRYFETAIGAEQPLPGYWWEPVSWRASAITPAHNYFMEYYAHALASFDATQIGNGGLTIGTMGHEEQIQEFARAYRALPAKHFAIYERQVTEPVQIRELWEPEKDRYWFYLINREHYPVQVDLTFDFLSTLTDLATGQKIQAKDGRLSLEIGPYELRSFLATPAAAKIISAQVTLLDLMGKE